VYIYTYTHIYIYIYIYMRYRIVLKITLPSIFSKLMLCLLHYMQNYSEKVGRPKLRRLDNVQIHLKIIGTKGWRRKVQD
jgi:hypothetical protein